MHAARLQDAGALSVAVQQQQLQANTPTHPAPPPHSLHRLRTASAPPLHHLFATPALAPAPTWSQAIASSGEVVAQLEQRLQAVRRERAEEHEAAAAEAAQATDS